MPISAAISAKRATRANAKINATGDGARQKGSWRRCSLVTARCGDAPSSLPAIRPFASTRDPSEYLNSLLKGEGVVNHAGLFALVQSKCADGGARAGVAAGIDDFLA